MKKLILVALIISCAAAITATASASGTSATMTVTPYTLCDPSGCGGGSGGGGNCLGVMGYSYAGYYKNSIPAIGGSMSANLNMVFSDVLVNNTTDHVAVYASVANGTYWLQAGIEQNSPTSGIHFYIEKYLSGMSQPQATIYSSPQPNAGQAYAFSIHHTGTGTWTADVPSHSISVSSFGPTETEYYGEAENLNSGNNGAGTCNIYDAKVSAMYPWGTGQMTQDFIPSIADGNKYAIQGVNATGFEPYGPVG